MSKTQKAAGEFLRGWRQRRRISQQELAFDAEVSSRHLSFVETGRAGASRDLLLRLAECLDMPLRARNRLLTAAGFAPVYPARPVESADMAVALNAVKRVLDAHMPKPALAIDRHWNLVVANPAVATLLAGVPEALLAPPVNVLRLCLHPDGLAPRIDNLAAWRHHLLTRFRRQIERTGDDELRPLYDSLCGLGDHHEPGHIAPSSDVAMPLYLRAQGAPDVLRFLSTTTLFGSPGDVTLDELAIECFYPLDDATRSYMAAAALRTA